MMAALTAGAAMTAGELLTTGMVMTAGVLLTTGDVWVYQRFDFSSFSFQASQWDKSFSQLI